MKFIFKFFFPIFLTALRKELILKRHFIININKLNCIFCRCEGCHLKFEGSEKVRKIGESFFHGNCFKCADCAIGKFSFHIEFLFFWKVVIGNFIELEVTSFLIQLIPSHSAISYSHSTYSFTFNQNVVLPRRNSAQSKLRGSTEISAVLYTNLNSIVYVLFQTECEHLIKLIYTL